MNELNRLRWNCRRGMLELDLVLTGFLEKHYPKLTEPEARTFKALLDYPDTELWDMIMDRTEPAEKTMKAILQLIRAS
ncbi:MAG TPA: succinate dehydrogenase assembly factor 2 [Burkholderiales bacterium]|nr:succinate dehydrogenase assembly factor 2 [Burkholderiales bacterium]